MVSTMTEKADPRWQQYGTELRRLRLQAGLTQEDLGAKTHLSKAMISGIERGTRSPKQAHSESFDGTLATGGTLTRLWEELSQQRSVPDWFRDAVLLERRALEMREWQQSVIPGLLQTADYARCLIRAWRVWDSDEQVERLVEARVARLPALTENRPLLWFVIAEAAFNVPVGDEKIWRDQVTHIVRLAADRMIQVQVLPSSVLGPGPTPSYRLMTLSSGSVVYAEHPGGGTVIDRTDQVRFMQGIFGGQQAAAMGCDASLAWLEERR
jgi:transcriptional regulator with XRE-family HTH domain